MMNANFEGCHMVSVLGRALKSSLWVAIAGLPALGFAQNETNEYNESHNQETFYVAPTGNDNNDGTFEAPFRTLHRAQKAVRTVNKDMAADVAVCLRAGTYQLTAPLELTNEDGGANGHYVRYVAYPGEHPLITGAQPVSGWELHDKANNIWKAANVDLRFRQLYVNGKKATRACFPNVDANGNHDFVRLTKVDTFGRAFDVPSEYVKDWNNFNQVEMHLMIAWADNILRLDKKQVNGGTTKLIPRDPERTRLFRRKYPMLGVAFMSNPPRQQCFYLENAYEFIDAPGEWYLDENTNNLYYKAREGEDMNTAVAVVPNIETLVNIQGKDADNKVGYIAFEGLTFAHTTFMRPSREGFLNLQAGMYNIDVIEENGVLGSNKFLLWRPEAGFRAENAHHLLVTGNVFSQMAATGLDFVSGTSDTRIEGNLFTQLGGTGIMLGKFSQDSLTEIHIPYNPANKAEICTRDTIRNNYVHHVTTEIQGAVGIGAGLPRDVLIEHNELAYMNYSGISVGFGWTKQPTAMDHNRINWNRIHHVSQLLADCGPIYTLSNQGQKGEIQYNYISDVSGSKYADYWVLPIYLDEGSSGFDVSHNVYDRAPGGVACNQCGSYTQSDNDGHSSFVTDNAGLENPYKYLRDIKEIPLPDFSNLVPQEPFKQLALPGLLQAEDYDLGGQNVSFYDTDFANQGNAYREDGVDIVPLGGDDAPDGYAVGYTARCEWMEYTVDVEESSAYKFRARVSSGLDQAGFRLYIDGEQVADTIPIPQGEDWDTYCTIEGQTRLISAGRHVLKLEMTGGYGNIDWLEFALPGQEFTSVATLPAAASAPMPVFNVYGSLLFTIKPAGNDVAAEVRAALCSQRLPKGVYFVKLNSGRTLKYVKTE